MLCPLQVESNQLYVVCLFESAREMIPKNERVAPAKELTWMDRMQLKLESLCDSETVRNPNQVVQETGAYIERQMTTAGTTMRKFCAEFVKEMLLPDIPKILEGSEANTLQSELGQNNGLLGGNEKPIKSAKVLDDAPAFYPEASISGSSLEDIPPDQITDVQHEQEASQEVIPSMEDAERAATFENSVVSGVSEQVLQRSLQGTDDQYAHWFVNEDYRAMRLGKSTSSASLQSCDGIERTASSDSLNDWELV